VGILGAGVHRVWRYLEFLDQQFHRLSALEKQVMYCLAKNQSVYTTKLEDIAPTVSYRQLLEALESLQQRSLIERDHGTFTQLPVIMEYITEQQLYFQDYQFLKTVEHQLHPVPFESTLSDVELEKLNTVESSRQYTEVQLKSVG